MEVRPRSGGEGCSVRVRVRPRSRPGLAVDGETLTIGVAAPAVEGRATEEARRALAAALDVPPSAVRLRSGARSRVKVFLVVGVEAAEAEQRLDSAVSRGT